MIKDSSLTSIVNQILPQFARFHTKPNNSKSSRGPKVAAAPIKEVNGVIQLLEDEEEAPATKKQKTQTNEVVELLDEEDSKKPAAVSSEPIVLDLT